MTVRRFTQRWWWYCGCLLARRLTVVRRHSFLQRWEHVWDLYVEPVRTIFFWLSYPHLYLQVRRGLRLLRVGRAEIEL
jgi:hypothetical protein